MSRFKPSGIKVSKTCQGCSTILREAQAYYTVENPPRRLCKACMARWLDISEDSL